MMGYAGAYRNMQHMPPMGGPGGPPWAQGGLGGLPGGQATPFGMPMPQTLRPTMGQAPPQMGGGGGGWLGALGKFTGWGDMSGMERAYMLASVGGGVADYFERRGEREEEKRRYEQALAEEKQRRTRMGQNWNAAMGGGY